MLLQVSYYILILLGIILVLLLLFHQFFIICRVCGDSMLPNFTNGELVIALKNPKEFIRGNVYIYPSPNESKNYMVIKRLERSHLNYHYFLGDNPDHSQDSRHYGYIEQKKIIAQVITLKHKKEGL